MSVVVSGKGRRRARLGAGLTESAQRGSPAGVNSMTQFVSQVSPPSVENACSQRGSAVVTPDQVNRTQNRAAVEGVRPFEDSRVTGERADERRIEPAGAAAVGPVDRPQLGLRVEEAERHPDEAAVVIRAEQILVSEDSREAGVQPRSPRTPPTPPIRRDAPASGGSGPPSGPARSRSRGLPARASAVLTPASFPRVHATLVRK